MRACNRFRLLTLLALIAMFQGHPTPVFAVSPPIGINVGGVVDWGPDFMFADAIKQARYWSNIGQTNYNIGDANGWPTQDCQVGIWYGSGEGAEGLDPMNGTYALSFNGEAASITASNGGVISNQIYNSGTNTTTATLTMVNSDLWMTFTGTQRTATSATNTGITNVKLMRPTTEGGTTDYATTVTFQPTYETMCQMFSVLRFMDTEATNGNQIVNWSDRTPPTWWSQSSADADGTIIAHCMSWEYVMQLCNETNRDAWINVPRFASSDYISKLAQLVKFGSNGVTPYTSTQSNPVWPGLNSNLHCYVEYSNENWNFTPGDLTAIGNKEIYGYPVTTNGLVTSVTNGSLSTVADGNNGESGPPTEIPGYTNTYNPNYFRDVIFNGSTSIFTSQTPASTGTDTSGGDEFGTKFTTSTAGSITGLRFYKQSGETGTHVGHLWQVGAPGGGNQACWIWDNGGYISQSMTFPNTGSYTVSFYATAVSGDPYKPSIQVSVDGTNVGTAFTPGYGFTQFTSAPFTISTTGAHTVEFTNTEPTDNGRALLSQVSVSGPGSVTVTNANFMSPNISNGPVPNVYGAGGFVYWDAAGWTQGGNGAGLTTNGDYGSWADFGTFGTLLGTVTFTGETSSGWQSQNFTSGISVAANTTYMVSVNNNSTYGYTNTLQYGPLSWDGDMTQGYYRRWVERAAQISQTFRSVFGDSAMPGTSTNPEIRPVLMMLASGGWIDNYTYSDLRFLQDYFNNQAALTATPDGNITTAHPPSYYFYSGGGAPYYDPSGTYDVNSVFSTGDWVTSNFIKDWLVGSTNDGTAEYYVPQWGNFISYEGGPELPDDSSLSISIFNSTNMEGLLTSHQTAYNQNGGALWVYYNSCNVYRWGFTTDIFNLTTPKMVGVSQIDASTLSPGTYGTGIPGTLAASADVPSYGGPNVSNMSASATHIDYAGYVVNVATASAFNIGLSAGSSGASNQADIYVDGALIGTVAIPNTGSNTTYGTTATVGSPNLAVGTHGILVKVHAGSFGMNSVLVTGGTVTTPNPPTGLTATGSFQQVSLAWTGSTGATGYNIYRGTTSGGESGTPIVTGIITTNYTNTGLTNGVTYYYEVAAANSAGTSGMSNQASAAAVDNTGHIVQTSTAPAINGTISAVWSTAPAYTVGNLYNGPIPTGQTFSATWKALWDNTNLYILAQVTNNETLVSDSSSPWLGDDVEVYIDATDAKPSSYGSNDFQYELGYGLSAAQAEYNTPACLTGVVYANAAVSGGWIAEASIPWTSLTVTPAVNNLIGWDVDVCDGFNAGSTKLFWWDTNNTDWDDPASFGTGLLAAAGSSAPPAPTGLTATPGNTQVALAWNASTGATSYNVYRGTTSGGESATAIATGITSVAYTNTSLTNGTTYYYKVAALNSVGTSGYSNEASATPGAAPAAPTGLIATPGNAQVALTWNSSTGATSYNVLRSTTSGSGYAQVVNVTTTSYTNTGLTNGTTYYYVVAAVNAIGTSANSSQASATPVAPPAAPTGLSAAAGNGQVALAWTASTGATSYNVYRGTTAGGESSTPVAMGIATVNYTNTGLANGTTYYFEVAAVNAGGTSGYSNEANAAPVGPPPAPGSLTDTPSNTINALAWSSSTGSTSYNVYRGTTAGGENTTPIATGITSYYWNYTDTGLTNGVTYYYKVTGVGSTGTSAYSNEAIGIPTTTTAQIAFATTTPVINGSSSAAWSGATSYNLATILDGSVPNGQTNTAAYQAMWDSTNLYVLAQVQDSTLIENTTPYNGDAVEIYIDGTNGKAGVYSATDWQYTFQWNNSTIYEYQTGGQGTNTAGMHFAQVNTSGGYNIEMSIPWSTIGIATPSANSKIGLDVHVDNSDVLGTRCNKLTWWAQADDTWAVPALFGTGTLISGVPAAPTGLAAAPGNAQVALTWTASSGATSYNVYRGTTAGGESATAIVTGVTTTAYTNSGLTNGTTYYYKVAALNASGTSGYSNEASATPVAPPAAPTGLTAIPGNAQVALAWSASTGATGYNVLRSTTSGSGYAQAAGVATTAYTNTGLTNGTTYYFVVAAINAGGTSANSSQASATPVAPPAAPTGLIATPGNGQVALSWSASTGATSYNVLRSTVSGSGYAQVVNVTTITYTNTGLTNGTTYYFVVAAVNAGGTSANSSQASATPTSGAPSAPTGLAAAAGTGNIALSWTASSGATSYNVYRSTTSGGEGTTAIATGITTVTFSNTGLTNATTYYYKVAAVNTSGTSAQSSEAHATPIAAPTALTATPGSAQIALAWSASAGATSYSVYRGTTAGGENGTAIATGVTAVSYTNTGLTNGTTYYYVVAAVNAFGKSVNSFEANATAGPPAAPTGLAASAGNTQVILSWTGSYGVTSYNVYRGTTAGGESATAIATGITITTYTNTGLTNGTTYYYKVAALDTGGTSAYSNEANTVCGAPAAPTGVAAVGTTALVATTWNASPGATSYNVYRGTTSGGESGTALATGVQPLGYNDSAVTNGTTYYYEIKGVDAVGTSGYSSEVSAVAGIPAAPTSPSATPGSATVSLFWVGNSGASSYNVYRGTTAGGESATPILTGNTTGYYTNTGLTNGVTYYYKVTSVDPTGTSGYSSEASATPSATTAQIAYATTTPVIDGSVDPIWSSTSTYSLSHVLAGTIPGGQSNSATYQALWDSSNLYVLVTVTDSELIMNTLSYNGDAVELYVDGTNGKANSYSTTDWQYVFPWNSSTVSEYQTGSPGTNTTGIQYGQTNISGGWRAEVAVPWSTIGVTSPSANSLIGLDVAYDNSDTYGTRCNKLHWWSFSDENWTDPAFFGAVTLLPHP